MSDDYYDSKGIRHYSEENAKRANEEYVREERSARERTVEASEKAALEAYHQRQAMAQMARQQAEASERLERIAEEQAENERKRLQYVKEHNRFQQDLLYLEKENPSDRKAYVIKRVLEEKEGGKFILNPPIQVIRRVVLTHMKQFSRYEPQLKEIRALSRQYAEDQPRQGQLESQRQQLQNQKKEIDAAQGGFGCGVIVLILVLCIIFYSAYASPTTKVSEGSFQIVFLLLIGSIWLTAFSLKKEKAIKKNCGGVPEALLKECVDSLNQITFQMCGNAAKLDSLKTSILRSLEQHPQDVIASEVLNHCSAKWYLNEFRKLVEAFQNDFPKSLRIDPNDVTELDLMDAYTEFMNKILPSGVAKEVQSIGLQIVTDATKGIIPGILS